MFYPYGYIGTTKHNFRTQNIKWYILCHMIIRQKLAQTREWEFCVVMVECKIHWLNSCACSKTINIHDSCHFQMKLIFLLFFCRMTLQWAIFYGWVCVCVLNESGGDFIEFRNRIHMNRMKIEFRIIRHLDLPYNKQARSSKKVWDFSISSKTSLESRSLFFRFFFNFP